jgi:hypothetical protein
LGLALGGCSFSASSSGGTPSDATIDSDPPVIDGGSLDGSVPAICTGGFVSVCVDPPAGPLMLTTPNIDTTNSPLCQPYKPTPDLVDACVIVGQSITLPSTSTVRVVGNRRLVLVATGQGGSPGSITIAGVLDASAHGNTDGPAGHAGPCGVGAMSPSRGNVNGGAGGGWGGSFGLAGNNGGTGASGSGGVAAAALNAPTLRGGCPGGDGADNVFGQGKGSRGGGGGSVLLIAGQTITISGTINASGGGGGGASLGAGGGGGGSGGMIVLDAITVTLGGKCFANGGGGGEGGNSRLGQSGSASRGPDLVGAGGLGSATSGGDGGNGGFGMTGSLPGGNGVAANRQSGGDGGGGGGGGGIGIILVYSDDTAGTDDPQRISPAPTPRS